MDFSVLINQILIFAILISVGIFAIKANIINNETKDGIARFVIDVTMPLLIFFSLINMEISTEIAKNSVIFIVLSYFSTFLLLATSYFVFNKISSANSKSINISDNMKQLFVIQSVFGNCVFFGFPFFDALFPGGIGLLYAILYYTVQASILWTLGIFILDKKKRYADSNNSFFTKLLKNLVKIINPNTVAFILGLIFLSLNVSFPAVIETSLGGLGKTSLYFSMIYIGATLGQMKLRSEVKSYSISFILAINKMIIIPLLMLAILLLLQLFIQLDSTVIAIIVLETGMPIMALLVVLAKKYDHDILFATENLFISTIFSLITLPLLYYIISFLYNTELLSKLQNCIETIC